MNIQGSMLTGKQVDIDIAGDLTIQSDKTSTTYRQKNAAIGVGIALDTTHGSASKGYVDYRLETVREQAGIFAGMGGLTVRVGGTTTLTGALIDSTADKDKNRITTGDLALYHITNKAILKDGDIGIGGSSGEGTKPNERGLLPQLPIAIGRDSTSHTYAAIVDGKLRITGNTNVSAADINRNTQDTLNALDNTLDLQAIQERKRLAELFAKYANAEVHKLSETQKWQEGSAEKVILHAVVGGLTAKLGGDTYTAGAMAGAVNELVNGEIDKYNRTHPTNPIDAQRHQWLSAAVGVIVNASTNQALQTGAAEAVYGTKWNKFGHGKPAPVSITEIAIGVETENLGHVSLIAGFADGTYQEGNFGRYGGVYGNSSGSIDVSVEMQGTYIFDDDYRIGGDNKTIYFLNTSIINANDVAWSYNNVIDTKGYQYINATNMSKDDREKNKIPVELRKGVNIGYYYRISSPATDYELLRNNCVTTTITPLFDGVSVDWLYDNTPAIQTLRLLRKAVSPYEIKNILAEDFRKFHGNGLVARIGGQR